MFTIVMRSIAALAVLICVCQSADAQVREQLQSRISQSINVLADFHTHVRASEFSGDVVENEKRLYTAMAGQMTPSTGYEHVPFPEDREQTWRGDALRVARGLRPFVNYEIRRGRKQVAFSIDDNLASVLFDNVKLIAWYRNEIDRNYSDPQRNVGTIAVATLIDEFLEELAGSIPRVRIRAGGKLNIGSDQEIEYVDENLWGIMAAINRYFYYKMRVHPDKEGYEEADYVLLESMAKTAAIYVARPPESPLQEVEFLPETGRNEWQQACVDAMESCEMELNGEHQFEQKFCDIRIPAKPEKPKAVVQRRNENEFPDDVEDVKDVGGTTFLKRNGRWVPWEKK